VLTGNNRARGDVYDESLDERMAPSLGGVVTGREHEIYMKPEEFFKRTLITEQIMDILTNILHVLKDGRGKKILVLSALYGGGKTHTLLTIYHALKAPHTLKTAKPENENIRARISKFIEETSTLKTPDIVVIDGYFSELAPTPLSPLDVRVYKVYTLWGYLAHSLGNYAALGEYDEKRTAPTVDKLLKIFENRSVVILIDEIAHYIKRLHESGDPVLGKYSSSVETFMEVLAKAMEISKNVVLIISLPAEKRGEEVLVESTYRVIKQSLDNIFKALARVHCEYIEPISPRNIPALLKTRLFEEVDVRKARDVYEIMRKVYEDKEVFGVMTTPPAELLETYPFHPLYISTLVEILDKHSGLQKTRDLLRVSRKVLRSVLRDGRTYDLIMPWHIDLENDSIRNMLLIGDYEGFKLIVEEDIKGRTKNYDKPLLAKLAAMALLVRTFVYGGGLVLPPKIEAFPSEQDLARMIYEPATFSKENLLPKDIVDAIKWMSRNLLYVVKDERTGRLWFTKYVTPIKYVEERAKRVDDLAALEMVREYAEKLLSRSKTDLIEKKSKSKISVKLFDLEMSKAMRRCEAIDADTKRYILLACIDVPGGEDQRRSLFEEILYRVKSGGTRRYANTIFIAFPSKHESVEEARYYAKILIACNEVKKEGIIEKMVSGFGGREAEIVREILERKLVEYESGVLETFLARTLAMFNKVAYPYYDAENLRNTVKEVECSISEDCITTAIEKCLSIGTENKIKTELDYDTLEYYLKNIGIDISEGDRSKSVESIIDHFYSNPRLPAAPMDAVKSALKECVKKLIIGIRADGKIYFKKIYEKEAPLKSAEGFPPTSLMDEYEILPWKMALVEQLKSLKRREFTENGVRKVEEYVIKISGKDILVEEVINNLDKFDYEQLRDAPILRIVKTVAVKIEIPVKTLQVNPGEQVSIDTYIVSIGPYRGEVVLKPSTGSVEKERFKIDESFTREKTAWYIVAPSEPGSYRYTIEVRGLDGALLDIAEVVVIVLGEEGWKEGLPPPGTPVRELEITIEAKPSLKPLEVLRKKLEGVCIISSGEFKITAGAEEGRESMVSLSVRGVKFDDLTALIFSVLNRFQLFLKTITLQIHIKPRKGEFFTMPVISEDEGKAFSECRVRYLSTQLTR
jgi:predicted AAA+ superfamily ATPase